MKLNEVLLIETQSDWEARHDHFIKTANETTAAEIKEVIAALKKLEASAGKKTGLMNKVFGSKSNGDNARTSLGAATLIKSIERVKNAKPGTDEHKELGQQLDYAHGLLKRNNLKESKIGDKRKTSRGSAWLDRAQMYDFKQHDEKANAKKDKKEMNREEFNKLKDWQDRAKALNAKVVKKPFMRGGVKAYTVYDASVNNKSIGRFETAGNFGYLNESKDVGGDKGFWGHAPTRKELAAHDAAKQKYIEFYKQGNSKAAENHWKRYLLSVHKPPGKKVK